MPLIRRQDGVILNIQPKPKIKVRKVEPPKEKDPLRRVNPKRVA